MGDINRSFDEDCVIEEMIEKAGGIGLFQIYAMVVLISGIHAVTTVITPIGFLLQMPDFKCTYIKGVTAESEENICTTEYICAQDPRIESWEVDYESERTLENFQTRFNLVCTPEWQSALIPGLAFLGWTLTLLWMPRLADIYGRRMINIVAQILTAVLFLMIYLPKT